MVTGVSSRLCPACERPVEDLALACESCGMFLDLRAAEGALQRVLDRVEEETAQLAVARALVGIPALTSQRYVRDWLLKHIPMAHSASGMVEVLGSIDDGTARSEASRLAIENFREKKLPGRWEVALARLSTPEARRALLAALTDKDDTARWTAAHAILEYWDEIPPEALPVLRKVLKNRREHEEILFCSAGSLARRDDADTRKEFLPRLLQAIRELDGANADEFPPPTRAAVLLCGVADASARREALQFLADRLPNGSEPILALALPSLLEEGADWLVAAMLHACRSRHPRSPSASTLARAFGDLRRPRLQIEAWERLREALGENPSTTDQPHCLTFLAALGHLHRPEAVPFLQELLQATEDAAVREAAREALARLGDPDAISHYREQLSAPAAMDEDTRAEWSRSAQKAVEVLGDVHDPVARINVIDALIRALAQPTVAREAACALLALSHPTPQDEPVEEQRVESSRQCAVEAPRPAEVALTANGASAKQSAPAPARAGSVPPPPEPSAQHEHRLVVVLEDVQRQVSALPHKYFAYDRMGGPERAEKERVLRHMLCGSLRALMDAVAGVTATAAFPGSAGSISLAYYLQARVHHALSCDAAGREAHGGHPLYHQRLENLNRAEECYRHAIQATDVAAYRARAYFDLAVLLAEADRRTEAMTAFEAVTDLDLTGALGPVAEQNLKRLQAAPAETKRSASRARASSGLPRILAGTMLATVVGACLWLGSSQYLAPEEGDTALWGMVRHVSWPLPLRSHKKSAPHALGKVTVSVSRLRVRSGRGTQYPVLKNARRGQTLTVIGSTDGWWKVMLPDNTVGWVARSLTGPLEET